MSENKRSMIFQSWGYVIPLLLVVYVLSIGPVAAIWVDSSGGGANVNQFLTFYSPLTLVMESNSWVESSVKEYVIFWRKIL